MLGREGIILLFIRKSQLCVCVVTCCTEKWHHYLFFFYNNIQCLMFMHLKLLFTFNGTHLYTIIRFYNRSSSLINLQYFRIKAISVWWWTPAWEITARQEGFLGAHRCVSPPERGSGYNMALRAAHIKGIYIVCDYDWYNSWLLLWGWRLFWYQIL